MIGPFGGKQPTRAMTSLFSALGGPHVDVVIALQDEAERKQVEAKVADSKNPDRKEDCPVYYDGEVRYPQVSSLYEHRLSPWWGP
jgi:hypothetical protein